MFFKIMKSIENNFDDPHVNDLETLSIIFSIAIIPWLPPNPLNAVEVDVLVLHK